MDQVGNRKGLLREALKASRAIQGTVNGSTLSEFKKFCKDGVSFSSGSWDYFECTFQTNPKDFLSFAKKDLASDCSHNTVNALSNIKRAIHCQVDTILMAFHLYEKAQKKEWSFPKRIECLNTIGIVSPKVLERINRKRNLLEHEYELPEKDSVEDAHDIAILFMMHTNHYLDNRPCIINLVKAHDSHCGQFTEEDENECIDAEVGDDTDSIEVRFNQSNGVSLVCTGGTETQETLLTIAYESDDYLEFLKMILEFSKE